MNNLGHWGALPCLERELNQMNQMIEEGKSKANHALAVCEKALQSDPDNPKLKLTIDLCKDQLASMDQKLEEESLKRIDRYFPELYIKLSGIFLELYRRSRFLHINFSKSISRPLISTLFVDYKDFASVKNEKIRNKLKERCRVLTKDGKFQFPIPLRTGDSSGWTFFANYYTKSVKVADLVILHAFENLPFGSVLVTVLDPAKNKVSGSQLASFMNKNPELFDGGPIQDKDKIGSKIDEIYQEYKKIKSMIASDGCKDIYEYQEKHPEYNVKNRIVVFWNMDRFTEDPLMDQMAEMVKDSGTCGIYFLKHFVYNPEINGDLDKKIQWVKNHFQDTEENVFDYFIDINNELTVKSGCLVRVNDFNMNVVPEFLDSYALAFSKRNNPQIMSPFVYQIAWNLTQENKSQIDSINKQYRNQMFDVPNLNLKFDSQLPIGSLVYPLYMLGNQVVELPYSLDLRKGMNLLLRMNSENRQDVLHFSRHMIWSMLCFKPVSGVKVNVIDGEERGLSIRYFLEIKKRCSGVFEQEFSKTPEEVTALLKRLNQKVDDLIQEKLGYRYRDLFEFNQNTKISQEPMELLLIYDFPKCMTKESLELLKEIMKKGGKCGIYTVICQNPQMSVSGYDSAEGLMEEIMGSCSEILCQNGTYTLKEEGMRIHIPEEPEIETVENFADDYADLIAKKKSMGVAFDNILPEERFAKSSARGFSIPIGFGSDNSIVKLSMGERASSHHGLVAGGTGSGKSSLFHTIIMSSMMNYSPDELNLYLLDFKEGTEFKVYESWNLPHIKVLAISAMQEFGESILQNLVQEMERRSELFKKLNVSDLKEYKKISDDPMPRILVMIDEFQVLFDEAANRLAAEKCANYAQDIVSKGRSYGIHLLMATQSTKNLPNLSLKSATVEQMRIRIGLKTSEYDANQLFSHENGDKALRMMKGDIGTAVMNLDYMEGQLTGLKVAYCDNDTQLRLLQEISEHYATVKADTRVFELGRKDLLTDYLQTNGIGKTDEMPVRIYLGQPVRIAPALSLSMDKKYNHNLLICGKMASMEKRLMHNYIYSALLNSRASVYCLDGNLLIDEFGSMNFYRQMADENKSFHYADNRQAMIQLIEEVYDLYQEWKNGSSGKTAFVIIRNLQYLDVIQRMLKKEALDDAWLPKKQDSAVSSPSDDMFSIMGDLSSLLSNLPQNEENSGSNPNAFSLSPSDKLIKLIEDGSGYGIHFVLSAQDVSTVMNNMRYAVSRTLDKFPQRILFKLSNDDASLLVQDARLENMPEDIVLYSDGVDDRYQVTPFGEI